MESKIPLNALRAFEAVGRHCHVRRAAEELHLTHAALSRQVRILEERLGTRLFNRDHNRMQLTPPGRRFLAVVQQSLRLLDEGIVQMDPESVAGELVIATTPTISTNWMPAVMRGFSRRYPEVELYCLTIEPHQRRLPREYDLAVCLGKPEAPGKHVSKLYAENYSPACAPGLLQIDRPITRPEDLLAYPLLHERFQQWSAWFALHGVDHARGAANIHFDYGFQSIEAARRGLGIVLADHLEVAGDLRRGSLVRLLGKTLPVDAGVYLVADQPEQQTVKARLFVEELIRCLKELGAAPVVDDLHRS